MMQASAAAGHDFGEQRRVYRVPLLNHAFAAGILDSMLPAAADTRQERRRLIRQKQYPARATARTT
jgi:hypothetical protein